MFDKRNKGFNTNNLKEYINKRRLFKLANKNIGISVTFELNTNNGF